MKKNDSTGIAYLKQQLVIYNEEAAGGRARVTTNWLSLITDTTDVHQNSAENKSNSNKKKQSNQIVIHI